MCVYVCVRVCICMYIYVYKPDPEPDPEGPNPEPRLYCCRAIYRQLFGLVIRALPGLNLSGGNMDARTICRVSYPGDPEPRRPRLQ